MPAPKGHAPYPGCEKGGRPLKYTKEFIDNEADELMKWIEKKENVFLEMFAFERGYYDELLSQWAKENEKFSIASKRFRSRQKALLQHGALTKKYNYNMAALVLSHSYGMHAKTEQTISGDSSNPLEWIISSIDGSTRNLIDEDKKE